MTDTSTRVADTAGRAPADEFTVTEVDPANLDSGATAGERQDLAPSTPNVGDPSGSLSSEGSDDHPSKWQALGDPRPDEPFVTYAEATVARLRDWENRIQAREAQLAARAFELETNTPPQRQSLPSEPVAAALRQLHQDRYLGGGDDEVATFATGLGLDPGLVGAVLAGRAGELGAEDVAAVCEGLSCSPFDVWGSDLGRSFLHAYGPERWPTHIEPLEEGRSLEGDDAFVRRRLDQQAEDIVTVGQPATEDGGADGFLLVTRFSQTGLIARSPDGTVTTVLDNSQPAEGDIEYHFTFARDGESEFVRAPIDPDRFARGCPAGYDADPTLAQLADDVERSRPGADMLRFTDPMTGAVQWLGRETPFDPWQTWDDPRSYYPGEPSDVLEGGGSCREPPDCEIAGLDLA